MKIGFLRKIQNGKEFSMRCSAAQLIRLSIFMLCFSLMACDFRSREEHIESYGKKMGPEGEMTKTDYIIRWPALYQKERKNKYDSNSEYIERKDLPPLAPPLTLKIPKEYLRVMELSTAPYIRDKKGKMIYISIISAIPGPKPWTDPLPWTKNTLEFFSKIKMERKKHLELNKIYTEAIRNSVQFFIHRESPFRLYRPNCDGLSIGQFRLSRYGFDCVREDDVDGLQRYFGVRCGKEVGKGDLQYKAADDKAPLNCFTERDEQILVTPPGTPETEQVEIICSESTCDAKIAFMQREVMVIIEDIRSPNSYAALSSQEYKRAQETNGGEPYQPKNPLLNQAFPELQRWRLKIDVARKLLNSFVVAESSP